MLVEVHYMSLRNISEAKKKNIAGRQFYKCANEPGAKLQGLIEYECPLWNKLGTNKGSFDESGYEIDHIKEYCISADNSIENLQALCKMCHSVKTKRFAMRDKNLHTDESSYHGDKLLTSKIDDEKNNILVKIDINPNNNFVECAHAIICELKKNKDLSDLTDTDFRKIAIDNWFDMEKIKANKE